MVQVVIEDGKERELIKIACDVTEGNSLGYRFGYRDTLGDEYSEYVEPAPAAEKPAKGAAPATAAPAPATAETPPAAAPGAQAPGWTAPAT